MGCVADPLPTCVLDGEGSRNILYIRSVDLTLLCLTFQNGIANGGTVTAGGALYVRSGAQVSVTYCVLKNNQTNGLGGAIYASGPTTSVSLIVTSFYDNADCCKLGKDIWNQATINIFGVDGCLAPYTESAVTQGKMSDELFSGFESFTFTPLPRCLLYRGRS